MNKKHASEWTVKKVTRRPGKFVILQYLWFCPYVVPELIPLLGPVLPLHFQSTIRRQTILLLVLYKKPSGHSTSDVNVWGFLVLGLGLVWVRPLECLIHAGKPQNLVLFLNGLCYSINRATGYNSDHQSYKRQCATRRIAFSTRFRPIGVERC